MINNMGAYESGAMLDAIRDLIPTGCTARNTSHVGNLPMSCPKPEGHLDAHIWQYDNLSTGERARGVAALHALADFYAENPDYPMPTHVMLLTQRTEADEVDEATRVAAVVRWANAHKHDGAREVESSFEVSAITPIMEADSHPFRATAHYAARLDARPARRYLP